MSIEFEEIFVSICILDVHLRILEVHNILIQRVLIASFTYFILKTFIAFVFHFNVLVFIISNLEETHLVLPPQQTPILSHPAPLPLLFQHKNFLILSQVPNLNTLSLNHHHKAPTEKRTPRSFNPHRK